VKMKIAILGSRGIPNRYGGYEAFAEEFSVLMTAKGHEVAVFNSSLHPYTGNNFKGVEIIRCYDPEDKFGTAGQFIYDLNCILKCRAGDFDIILQLGYTSNSVWGKLLPSNAVVITNMDGLEWQRSKYSAPVRKFLERAEKWAVKTSDVCLADNPAIQSYLDKKYAVESVFIPYGATPVNSPDSSLLRDYGVEAGAYNIVVARPEPENNIETVIQGHLESKASTLLLIAGSFTNKYGLDLERKYATANIIFTGGIYDVEKLNALRFFSNIYFHGHSVGGTNPSLLEAMAASALVCAHDNVFNRAVLNDDGFYFKNKYDIAALLDKKTGKSNFPSFINDNRKKIAEKYSWDKITSAYETLFMQCLDAHEKRRST
jgi:glycosyltransferase involved in cell wall biosynthesis